MKRTIIIQFLFFFLSFYCFGAAMMDILVIYQGWKFVGAAEFPVVHEVMGRRIVQVVVIETLVMTVMTILMLWHRHRSIPKIWIWAAFGCEVIAWVSSALIQIPLQFALQHKDEAALSRLLATDWIRVIAFIVYIIIVSRMLLIVLQNSNRNIGAAQ